MIAIPNQTIQGSMRKHSWGAGFDLTSYELCAKASLQLFPGAMVKGNRSDNHPWSFTKIYRSWNDNNYYQTGAYPYWQSWTGPGAGGYPSAAIPTIGAVDPYNKCLDKIYSSIRGDMDLSIDLAQFRQTTNLLDDCAKAIIKIARGLTSVRKLSEAAANAWLLNQYGVKPTMQTMHDLVGKQIELTCRPVRFKERASTSNSSKETLPDLPTITTTRSQTINSRIQMELEFSVADAERFALSTYTSLNPASIIWELIPGSFIADWFLDIGGYLRNAETALFCGLQCNGGYVTRTSLSKSTNHSVGYSNSNRNYIDCTAVTEVKTMARTVLGSGMPMPQLPRWDVHMGSQRLASAAALLRQVLKAV